MMIALVLFSFISLGHAAIYYDITMADAIGKLHGKTMLDLINTAGLTPVFLDPHSNLTLFLPNDNAFSRDLRNLGMSVDDLKKDVGKLKKILTYHVLYGHYLTTYFYNEKLFTTASGDMIRTNHYLYNDNYFVDGAEINHMDIETSNGIIHTISHILFPFAGTVYDQISIDPDLSTLKAAIDAAGLQTFLTQQNPITIFCPTNNAFGYIGVATFNKLLTDKTLLSTILSYHVIAGSLYRGGMHDWSLQSFDANDKLTLDHHGSHDDIDNSRFVKYDVSASNGVLHKIDSVLIPDSVEDQVKNL